MISIVVATRCANAGLFKWQPEDHMRPRDKPSSGPAGKAEKNQEKHFV